MEAGEEEGFLKEEEFNQEKSG